MRDVVVVGAGPAGLLAAIAAAERGADVLLLEKATKPGVKILISGGTRCNVANAADRRTTAARFGHGEAFLRPSFRRYFRDDVFALLAREGVAVALEDARTGKYFPASDRALDVQRALVRRAASAGVELRLAAPVEGVDIAGEGFAVATAGDAIAARAVVLALGGRSWPKVGTTGDGYRIARALGHTVGETRPGLVPLRARDAWVGALAGIVVPWAVASWSGGGRRVARAGDLLFTHVGLSGPGPMDLSSELERAGAAEGATVALDLVPRESAEALRARLIAAAARDGARRAVRELEGDLPQRLLHAVFERARVPHDRRLGDLTKPERAALVAATKGLEVVLDGTLGFDKAEVTVGGVALDEVDAESMASKKVRGLYLAGEVLDLDGPIGGFNFQAAFSTGHLAGASAAEWVAKRGQEPFSPDRST